MLLTVFDHLMMSGAEESQLFYLALTFPSCPCSIKDHLFFVVVKLLGLLSGRSDAGTMTQVTLSFPLTGSFTRHLIGGLPVLKSSSHLRAS